MKLANNNILKMMNSWYYMKFLATGSALDQKSIDQIIATNEGQAQKVIDRVVAEAIVQACGQENPALPKELMVCKAEGFEDQEGNRRVMRWWERERSNAEEAVSCFKYYGTAGMSQDCHLLVSEWDVDWEVVRKVKWGIAQGSE